MLWSIIQTIGRQGATLLVFTVLALILSPADFGILGIAMILITFGQAFSEMGFESALIQQRDIEEKDINTIMAVNILTGIILTICGIAASWYITAFFKTPQAQPVAAVLSLTFIINSFSITQTAIIKREMKFKELTLRDISATILSGIVGISLALTGFGVWSLVAQVLTGDISRTFLIWKFSTYRVDLTQFSRKSFERLWPYSSKMFAFNIFKYFAQNVDYILIGYFLGPIELGLYTFAYRLIINSTGTFVGSIGNYLFPKFSSIQDNLKSIRFTYISSIKTLNIILIPSVVFIIFLSPLVIPIVFGEKWQPSINIIQILSTIVLIYPLWAISGQLTKSLNRPGWLLNWSIFFTFICAVFILSGIICANYRINGAAWGLTIAYFTCTPIIFFINKTLINLKLRDFLDMYMSPFLSSLLIILLLEILSQYTNLSAVWVITLGMILGSCMYIIGLVHIDKLFVFAVLTKIKKEFNLLRLNKP